MSKNALKIIDIPKDATNGDVIKAMFPNLEFRKNKCGIYANYFRDVTCKELWWNEPYMEDDKE